MSDDFPYTPDEVGQFHRAYHEMPGLVNPATTRRSLWQLHEAGIELTFPEPRFYVEQRNEYWVDVWDRKTPARLRPAASFDRAWYRDAHQWAQDFANRLNREMRQ